MNCVGIVLLVKVFDCDGNFVVFVDFECIVWINFVGMFNVIL